MTNRLDKLTKDFIIPKEEFTPVPFWFWNDDLKANEILKQIQDFKNKGISGFVIHPRIGIPKDIGYMSRQFLDAVITAVKEAARLSMKVILYDEGMYPSGSAHGEVVASNPQYASRGLMMSEFSCTEIGNTTVVAKPGEKIISVLTALKNESGGIIRESIKELNVFEKIIDIPVDIDNKRYVYVFTETYTGGHIRGIHYGEDDGDHDAPPSADLLNPKAIEKFISLTHERYYQELKEYFGTTITGVFTDEPSIMGRGPKKGLIPWTNDFLNEFIAYGNTSKDLVALWLDVGPASNEIRKRYKKCVRNRLQNSYYSQISDWCTKRNVNLTGHPGDADDMGMLKYFHIPGQDVVWRWVAPEDNKALEGPESTQAKCSSDAARHMNKTRNSNECFGCCGPKGLMWEFKMDDMKWYMDWLFVRGVNLLYPHAFFYSIREERKNERPPDVGPNNLWWPYYRIISDYIKRMSRVMTGINLTPIAVLCCEYKLPWKIPKILFENQIEFNYLSVEILKGETQEHKAIIENGSISIYEQRYKVLIIEDYEIIDSQISLLLQKFIAQGGRVLLPAGEYPYEKLTCFDYVRDMNDIPVVLDSIDERDILITPKCKDIRVSHVIKDGIHMYLLTNEGEDCFTGLLEIAIIGQLKRLDLWEGKISDVYINKINQNKMTMNITVERRQSIIICVDCEGQPVVCERDNNIKLNNEIIPINKWEISGIPTCVGAVTNLVSWTEYPEMINFSGTCTYIGKFNVNSLYDNSYVCLDLGKVCDFVNVIVNGVDKGVVMWAPYKMDITDVVVKGENIVKLAVTNSIANCMEHAETPSGLIGPIKINIVYDSTAKNPVLLQ